jgi:excisionase family DNA binding protein
MATNEEDQMLDVWQLAELLGMSEPTARRLIRDGVLPVHKVGGKKRSRIRIARSDVAALLAASRVEATTGPLATKK